jgi:hypothetical protein
MQRLLNFLLLGSASPNLVRGVSESLAGRVRFVRVPGFAIDETGGESQNRLWMRGGFPRAYLARGDEAWRRWIDGFVTTFLERDIPQMGIRVPAAALRRWWICPVFIWRQQDRTGRATTLHAANCPDPVWTIQSPGDFQVQLHFQLQLRY